MVTEGRVDVGCCRLGTGAVMNASGDTVREVNERVTTGEVSPAPSTARSTNVCASREYATVPAGGTGFPGEVEGTVSVSVNAFVAVHAVSASGSGSSAYSKRSIRPS